ncbi:short-chain dehydrogenase [Nocardioides szechwanensis]|uniref:NAD(P)-dependent dehydrogenase, short-chain alcohol dehydrogenase family n=1 Tax=Nocardioides szechwanensis TaxID=1005944 RepID=A0A1G9WRI8_9ACTN|nr:SDR family oxidoreductase [Nocardioides szechwanensis]GEP32557.1 short-chain dehydrogenase [Nocardioides szechwanensis]SDM86746.1 NAD(P)-dependent dehydrogenase, short-chain alcohol dehydrogenase family [Nocardioides szechwanensis]
MDQGQRVAVVVGGASGIGAAIATALEADGCTVVVADLPREEGSREDGYGVDVTDEASVEALFAAVLAEHGRVDVVVNSAGVSTLGLLTELDVAEFRRVVDVNLTGAFLVLKHAGRAVADGGAVISLTSLNARQPGTGMGAYCAAKAGLAMLTEVAALELAPRRVRVNAISPGLVLTPLTAPAMDIAGIEDDYLANTPLGRAGLPEEIAAAAVYIAGALWLTGEVLDLNGGAHLQRYPDIHGHVMRAFA